MVVSRRYPNEQVRQWVLEYVALPYGRKGPWLEAHGVSMWEMARWRGAVFEGDLERGPVPRQGSAMDKPGRQTAMERNRAREAAAHAAEVSRLEAQIEKVQAEKAVLQATNEALG